MHRCCATQVSGSAHVISMCCALCMQAAALLQRHPGVEDLDLSGLVYRPGLDAHFVATIAPALGRCVPLSEMNLGVWLGCRPVGGPGMHCHLASSTL